MIRYLLICPSLSEELFKTDHDRCLLQPLRFIFDVSLCIAKLYRTELLTILLNNPQINAHTPDDSNLNIHDSQTLNPFRTYLVIQLAKSLSWFTNNPSHVFGSSSAASGDAICMNTAVRNTSRHSQLTILLTRNLVLFFEHTDEPLCSWATPIKSVGTVTVTWPYKVLTCDILRRKCEIDYFINRQLIFLNKKG